EQLQEQRDVLFVPLEYFFFVQLLVLTGKTDDIGLDGMFDVASAAVERHNHRHQTEALFLVRAQAPEEGNFVVDFKHVGNRYPGLGGMRALYSKNAGSWLRFAR